MNGTCCSCRYASNRSLHLIVDLTFALLMPRLLASPRHGLSILSSAAVARKEAVSVSEGLFTAVYTDLSSEHDPLIYHDVVEGASLRAAACPQHCSPASSPRTETAPGSRLLHT
jgi:hypothetical protein